MPKLCVMNCPQPARHITATVEIARRQISTWHKAKAKWLRKMEWWARRLCSTRPCISHTHNILINQSEESSKLVITREHKFPHNEQTRGREQRGKWKKHSTSSQKWIYCIAKAYIVFIVWGLKKENEKTKWKSLKRKHAEIKQNVLFLCS